MHKTVRHFHRETIQAFRKPYFSIWEVKYQRHVISYVDKVHPKLNCSHLKQNGSGLAPKYCCDARDKYTSFRRLYT